MIKTWLVAIAEALFEKLKPVIVETLRELSTDAVEAVKNEIRERIPEVIHAVVAAVVETSGQLAAKGVDELTNAIPGQLDDQIFDGLVNDVLHRLGLNR